MSSIKAIPCPIEFAVLDRAQANRPAIPMPDASFVTVHEVGNLSPGADEDMHRDFVWNGGGSNSVSFHFIVGPTKAIQLLYLNENAWHASDGFSGRGNRDTIAIETVQVGDFTKTLGHLAFLIKELYENPERFKWRSDVGRTDDLPSALAIERTKQHNFWAPDKKNCPQFIRDRGLWQPLLNGVANALTIRAYTSPILPSWWSEAAVQALLPHTEDGVLYTPLGTQVTALKTTRAYAHGWHTESKGKFTRAPIQAGEAIAIRYVCRSPENGKEWGITKHGTWVYMSQFTPRIIVRQR